MEWLGWFALVCLWLGTVIVAYGLGLRNEARHWLEAQQREREGGG